MIVPGLKRVLSLLSLLWLCLAWPAWPDNDPVDLSFAVLGGHRLALRDWQAQRRSNPSSSNLAQLRQTMTDLAGLDPVPNLTFFTGDLVDNLARDEGQTLASQLEAWVSVVRATPLWGRSLLVPMPGNHEVLQLLGKGLEVPNPPCYRVWRDWLKLNGLDRFAGNGPDGHRANPDHLVEDQSTLTYSFDQDGVHFIVVNTDSLTTRINHETGHPFTGWVPLVWITADLARAQADPRVQAIFMLGHKPLGEPHLAEEGNYIHNSEEYNLSDQLRAALLSTPKFRAYLTGHEHLWEASRWGPKGAPWQVIIGNGGAPLNKRWVRKGDPYFGFTVLRVYHSGRVTMVNYRRPVPRPYYGDTEPAQPQEERTLYP